VHPYLPKWCIPNCHFWCIAIYRSQVCAGYSNLFQQLCTQSGIRSVYITGHVRNTNEEHAWNAVSINHKWYLIDATWGRNYFLLNPEYFLYEHFPNSQRWSLMTRRFTKAEWLNESIIKDKRLLFMK